MGEHALVLMEKRETTAKFRNPAYGDMPFWLPLEHIIMRNRPGGGGAVRVEIPAWLERKHRQLAGDAEFEKSKEQEKAMAYEQRPNSGSLFKNDRRENDKQPDYKGSAQIEGVGEVWISAWIKEGKNGKFMSLSFRPKDEQKSADKPTNSKADLKDEIPF